MFRIYVPLNPEKLYNCYSRILLDKALYRASRNSVTVTRLSKPNFKGVS